MFNSHSKKVEIYKKNCITKIGREPETIKTCFVIEDVTMLGTFYKESGERGQAVELLMTKQVDGCFQK